MKFILSFLSLGLLFGSCHMKNEFVYSKLHTNVYRINNQYFYDEKVHTYLIELEDKVMLFDIPTYSVKVENFIESFNKPVFAIISHGSCGIADGTKWQKRIGLKVYAHSADIDHPWLRMVPDVFFTGMPEFGKNIEVIHTPGHSTGAICVLDRTSKSLFTGDTFYGNSNGGIKDFSKETPESYENPLDRIESCKRLLSYDFENIYPFHYQMIEGNGRALLAKYIYGK